MDKWYALAVALLVIWAASPATAEQGCGNLPISATVTLEKAKVLPGDTIEVTLSNFRDSDGNQPHSRFRIIVQALYGEILGGVTLGQGDSLDLVPLVPGGSTSLPAKVFPLGEGKIKFRYRAPLTCHPQGDPITVTNSLVLSDVLTTPLAKTEPLRVFARKTVAMSCPDYAIIAFRHTVHSVQSGQTWKIDQEVAVRIKLLPGMGEGIYRIGAVKTVAFKGKAEYRDRDEHKVWVLAGAVPEIRTSHLKIWYDRPSAKARAAIMPLVEVQTSWSGPPGWAGERMLAMEPVSEMDPKEQRRAMREMRKHVGPDTDPDAIPDMYTLMQRIMPLLEQITTHPDFRVTWGDGKQTMGGDGRHERRTDSGSDTKAYSWRIFLRP